MTEETISTGPWPKPVLKDGQVKILFVYDQENIPFLWDQNDRLTDLWEFLLDWHGDNRQTRIETVATLLGIVRISLNLLLDYRQPSPRPNAGGDQGHGK